ncbi:hypothetical protein [Kaistella sp.]|uniref:hypothetical protein n=1 Tax=Kaistella sp. TaxID=2782235 RepID=UPI003C3F67CB
MKNLLLIIPILLLSCNKEKVLAEKQIKSDSAILSDPNNIVNKMDSAANGIVSIDENNALKESFKTERVVDGNEIIHTINAADLPITIADEFSTNDQQLVVKIKYFIGKKIVGKITPKNSNMNIRFNQIKLPNGNFDGPFGREISYDIKTKGELWLIIGKSLMASGEEKGKFTVDLE